MSAGLQGVKVNDYIVTVSKGGQDISQSFIYPFLIAGARSIYPALPVNYPDSLSMTLNYVLSAFHQQVKSQEVLSNQMLITMNPRHSLGHSLHMTVKDDQPFLTVEDAPHLSFPLGEGVYFSKLMEAPTIELAFAATQLELYANSQKKNGKYEDMTVGWDDLHSWYAQFEALDKLEEGARAALKDGVIECVDDEPADNSFYLQYREASSFYWVP